MLDMFNQPVLSGYFSQAAATKGGGGFENWALMTYLLYVRGINGDFYYRREYPMGNRRVDLAINAGGLIDPSKNSPLILTEWKVNNNYNNLFYNFSLDIEKFDELSPLFKNYPCPFVFGIGPHNDGNPPFYFGRYGIPNTNLAFYYSTWATWKHYKSLYDQTWYWYKYGETVEDLTSER
ncbi:hypothetical protein Q5530_28935 [Saccharothrix sp. BKS2]|uniref:hypothetical protein n=1 Tax=Saccharothrix sp. BKS2 TaxID=3064400 RepID=UPI0039E84893